MKPKLLIPTPFGIKFLISDWMKITDGSIATCGAMICAMFLCLAQTVAAEDEIYSLGRIDASKLVPSGTSSIVKLIDGVKYTVHSDGTSPKGAVVYCVNTGRKQLVLTTEKHLSILNGLVSDGFTVVIADFSDKKIDPGIALEKYVVAISENARNAAANTSTPKNDYFVIMPGFTVKRDVVYFRYTDVPSPLRELIAKQKKKKFTTKNESQTATMDVIYPKYGPPVPVLGNYGSNSKGERQAYFATDKRHMVMSFALKNMAISHHHHWLDPYCGYTSPRGVTYYGNQFALKWVHFIRGNAKDYNFDTSKIISFGHSKGSEVPGKLVNKLRQTHFLDEDLVLDERTAMYAKDFLALPVADRTLKDPYANESGEIALAIVCAGIGNFWMHRSPQMPWDKNPVENVSPFFIAADHAPNIRNATEQVVALAKKHGVAHGWGNLDSHDWPHGPVFDDVSAFVDDQLKLTGTAYGHEKGVPK